MIAIVKTKKFSVDGLMINKLQPKIILKISFDGAWFAMFYKLYQTAL